MIGRREFLSACTTLTMSAALPGPVGGRQRAGAARDVYLLGARKHLFIDDLLVASTEGVVLNAHPPARREMVLVADRPWEAHGITGYGTVLWDEAGRQTRLYYVPIDLGSSPPYRLALATSGDGRQFDKPELEAVAWQGSRRNNIVVDAQREGTVLLDPTADAAQSYGYLSGGPDGIHRFSAADGIHFVRRERVSPYHPDSQIASFWDASRQAFAHYVKVYHFGKNEWYSNARVAVPTWFDTPVRPGRAVARVVTRTLQEPWDDRPLELVMAADRRDPRGLDLYTSAAQKYSLADDVYLAFPSAYYHYNEPGRQHLNRAARELDGEENDGTIETQLATSRDGIRWRRFRVPYVPLHNVDDLRLRIVMVYPGMIVRGTRIEQYFAGYTFTHGDTGARRRVQGRALGGVFRLEQTRDRFVSADFSYEGGTLTTQPFVFEGQTLTVNLDTSASGEARVELQSRGGVPLRGFTLAGCDVINANEVAAIVTWNGVSNVGAWANKPIRLRFWLRGARLFGFQFT
jgi:hypothetical protein